MIMQTRFAAIAIVLAGMTTSAQAGYYVLPFAQLESQLFDPATGTLSPQPGYQVLNGYEENGATSKQAELSDADGRHAFASVDLASGELKARAGASGGTRSATANAIFGDTVTITGGAGTVWDFSLALDGFFELAFGAPIAGPPTHGFTSYDVTLAIYRPGVTTFSGWAFADVADALFFASVNNLDNSGDIEDSFISISETIASSLLLESDLETFEVYARIATGAGTSTFDGIEEILADFSQTATLAFDFDGGVTTYSDSGALLGYGRLPVATDVPAPGGLALLCFGLFAGAMLGRRPA